MLARVLLVTEGTYPYHWGGVSTWCHSLTHELAEIEFVLLALARDPLVERQFELAPNVVQFETVPLWGVLNAWELPRRGVSAVSRADDAALAEFLPLFRSFVGQLLGAPRSDAVLARAIHGMHRFFLEHDFDAVFRSRAVWDGFSEEIAERFRLVSAAGGYGDATVSLADLTAGLQCLYHWFFPLSRRLPRADIVHAAMVGVSTLVATAVKLETGTPFLLSEHGIYLRERYLAEHGTNGSLFLKLLKLGFARRMTELSYRLADVVSPCCDDNQRWELRNGAPRGNLETAYYGIDPARFTPAPKPVGPPLVVWAGRLHPIKDVETLLRAAAAVHVARPEVRFKLFGSAQPGTEWYVDRCIRLHRELRLGDTVTFAGFQAHTPAAFRQADLVVLSSISEGFPFTTLEGMLCGKPVVATAVGGVREQVPPWCGLTVEPRDPKAMAEAILSVLADPDACAERGRAARVWAESMFSVDRFRASHYALYGRLAQRRSAGWSGNGRVNGRSPSRPRRSPDSRAVREKPTPIDVSRASASLTAELAARVPQPVDALELTAVIESLGVTDSVAKRRYGAEDAFELGERAFAAVSARPKRSARPVEDGDREETPSERRRVIDDATRGVIALAPLLLVFAVILAFADSGMTGGQILALGLGMTLSVALANGFVQAISRRTAIYLGLGQRHLAGRLVALVVLIATTAVTALGVLAFLVMVAMGAFAADERLIFAAALVCSTPVWLIAGGLSLARAAGWVSVGLGAGLLAGIGINELAVGTTSAHLLPATTIGLAVAIAVLTIASQLVYAGGSRVVSLPPVPRLARESAVYFAYGIAFMAFVLEPQLVAWLGASSSGLSRLDAVTAVEVGFTLALPPLILGLGVAELALRRFWVHAKTLQRLVPADERPLFGEALVSFHRSYLALYLTVSGVLGIGMLVGVELALRSGLLSNLVEVPSESLTEFVFVTALFSFWLLGWAQFNCMFVLNLVRPERALHPVLAGIVVATATGIPLTLAGFGYSMLGFVAGAAAFAWASSRDCRRVLAEADHHYAAAF